MKQPHKHAALIKAWADGAEIEYWNDYRNAWLEICAHPDWMPTTKYRIKPEPKPDVVGFCRVDRFSIAQDDEHDLRLTFDGETGKLKKAEVIE